MNRYLIHKNDLGYGEEDEHFVEFGLFRFWEYSMQIIRSAFPPVIIVNDPIDAFKILTEYIKRCGSSLIIDFRDGCNTDHFDGVEQEGDTLRLIWYSVDKNDPARYGEEASDSDELLRMGEEIFGKNLEDQYGFTFDYMLITPSYLHIYSKNRDVPDQVNSKNELIKSLNDDDHTIYIHQFGNYDKEPIVQYLCRYYCDSGLTAIITPKACRDAFRPDDIFYI